mmetsp:Transcript_5456/g.13179  ORF Transcript_5456/g.13179 Transcript_5456/m.13179 type:complete len:206 (+) Transcript_5456:1967-2584(+)
MREPLEDVAEEERFSGISLMLVGEPGSSGEVTVVFLELRRVLRMEPLRAVLKVEKVELKAPLIIPAPLLAARMGCPPLPADPPRVGAVTPLFVRLQQSLFAVTEALFVVADTIEPLRSTPGRRPPSSTLGCSSLRHTSAFWLIASTHASASSSVVACKMKTRALPSVKKRLVVISSTGGFPVTLTALLMLGIGKIFSGSASPGFS